MEIKQNRNTNAKRTYKWSIFQIMTTEMKLQTNDLLHSFKITTTPSFWNHSNWQIVMGFNWKRHPTYQSVVVILPIIRVIVTKNNEWFCFRMGLIIIGDIIISTVEGCHYFVLLQMPKDLCGVLLGNQHLVQNNTVMWPNLSWHAGNLAHGSSKFSIM